MHLRIVSILFQHPVSASCTESRLWPNSLHRAARFANFEGILGFYIFSIILADLLGNTCLLVIGVFRSTLFVSVCQGSLLVIALFRAMID